MRNASRCRPLACDFLVVVDLKQFCEHGTWREAGGKRELLDRS
jgi:hypothetical protein